MPSMESKFINFTNNVFCRRESNQHKARLIWEEIKYNAPEDKRRLFETEWNHYIRGEFDGKFFGQDINKLKPYF